MKYKLLSEVHGNLRSGHPLSACECSDRQDGYQGSSHWRSGIDKIEKIKEKYKRLNAVPGSFEWGFATKSMTLNHSSGLESKKEKTDSQGGIIFEK